MNGSEGVTLSTSPTMNIEASLPKMACRCPLKSKFPNFRQHIINETQIDWFERPPNGWTQLVLYHASSRRRVGVCWGIRRSIALALTLQNIDLLTQNKAFWKFKELYYAAIQANVLMFASDDVCIRNGDVWETSLDSWSRWRNSVVDKFTNWGDNQLELSLRGFCCNEWF